MEIEADVKACLWKEDDPLNREKNTDFLKSVPVCFAERTDRGTNQETQDHHDQSPVIYR